ncbi:MAG TPA: sulfotransferase [Steroidobacteraceae bacterium]|jgi:tetratricopeptide (TPR) repeat protein|nr:sulfotransferase [Steroidobacteraceae bacterium]
MTGFQGRIEDRIGRAIAAYESGAWAEAEAVCAAILKADRDQADALQILGNIRARSGDTQGAQPFFERARKAAPGNIYVLNSLGGVYAANGKLAEAREALEAALRIDGDFPWALQNLGGILMELGDRPAARRCFERALMADPRHVDSIAALADLAEKENRLEDAGLLVRQALTIAPGFLPARVVDARLALREGRPEAAEPALRQVIAQLGNAKPSLRATAVHFLGEALESQGRYAEAFEAFREANEIERKVQEPRFADVAFAASPATITKLTAFLRTADPADWPPPPPDGLPTPAFLVGFPRSGTTLLQQVLAGHPDVVTLEEQDNFRDAHEELLLPPRALEGWASLPPATLAKWRAEYWRRVERRTGALAPGRLYLDKLPLNLAVLPVIHLLFPGARILLALRDPRDAVLSCYRSHFAVNGGMFQFLTLEGAARYYDAVMGVATLSRERLPLPVHALRYEDLVGNFRNEVTRVLGFLGLSWADDVLRYAETARGRTIQTPSATQVIKPIYASAIGQWRRYEAALAPVLPILEPWVRRFGYDDLSGLA